MSDNKNAEQKLLEILNLASRPGPAQPMLVEILGERCKKLNSLTFAWSHNAGMGMPMWQFIPVEPEVANAAANLINTGKAAPGSNFGHYGYLARPIRLVEHLRWGLDQNDGVVSLELPNKVITLDSKTYAPAIKTILTKLGTEQATIGAPVKIEAQEIRPIAFKPA